MDITRKEDGLPGKKYSTDVFSLFRKKEKEKQPLFTDLHSHLLPGLDDGVQSPAESLSIIRQMQSLGLKKAVTTPHIMSDTYRNTAAGIRAALREMQAHLAAEGMTFELQAAAEYYLDEVFFQQVKDQEPLLTFGDGYLLFETNFLTEPYHLKEFLFTAATHGYKPVLAHPERYQYLVSDFAKVEDLRNRNVLFQINVPSLAGAYSKPIQRMAQHLIDLGWVDFLGSDCHNEFQAALLKQAMQSKYYRKALDLPLINRSL